MENQHRKKSEKLHLERLSLQTEADKDAHFIKNIRHTLWNHDSILRARRLADEGKLEFVTVWGGYGTYVSV